MRSKFTLTLTAAALSAMTAAGAAQAGNLGNDKDVGKADASVGASVSGASISASASATANGKAMGKTKINGASGETYGQVIAGLQSQNRRGAVALPETVETGQVEVLLLSDLRGNAAGNAAALDNALAGQTGFLATLRGDLDADAAIVGAIEAAGFTTADVVGIQTAADGSVRLIVDDRG